MHAVAVDTVFLFAPRLSYHDKPRISLAIAIYQLRLMHRAVTRTGIRPLGPLRALSQKHHFLPIVMRSLADRLQQGRSETSASC
jgi:hypothetical protein